MLFINLLNHLMGHGLFTDSTLCGPECQANWNHVFVLHAKSHFLCLSFWRWAEANVSSVKVLWQNVSRILAVYTCRDSFHLSEVTHVWPPVLQGTTGDAVPPYCTHLYNESKVNAHLSVRVVCSEVSAGVQLFWPSLIESLSQSTPLLLPSIYIKKQTCVLLQASRC